MRADLAEGLGLDVPAIGRVAAHLRETAGTSLDALTIAAFLRAAGFFFAAGRDFAAAARAGFLAAVLRAALALVQPSLRGNFSWL